MTLGVADRQGGLFDDLSRFCDQAVPEQSVYAVLHRERDRLFPDGLFADLFSDRGRPSVPPSVVATVMVLQRLEGLSDREAVDRFAFDARWRYAAGVGGWDQGGWGRFAHTVLVDMRARLAASKDPRRIFAATVQAASAAGLVGVRRVLDSTPLYDAVATMDTLTLVRSAIRGLLGAADEGLAAQLRAVITSGDDYASNAKPQIDWDDAAARETLIDSRAKDARACLALLDGRELAAAVAEAAQLLAAVLGQDLEATAEGVFRIARRVAPDRLISTVDPDARHGHKTSARGFDGYKGHLAGDPDSEIITNTQASAAGTADASVAVDLIDDLTAKPAPPAPSAPPAQPASLAQPAPPTQRGVAASQPKPTSTQDQHGQHGQDQHGQDQHSQDQHSQDGRGEGPKVYGDASYGTGELLDHLAEHGITSGCKTQPPSAPGGRWAKDRFVIDLEADTVTCPANLTVAIRRNAEGDGTACFADACATCPLRSECTNAKRGRTIRISRYEQRLADARRQQQDPEWAADYRATRPKIERKIGHLMRRRHGGRRARVRGLPKVDADFNLLAAAVNIARLAVLGLCFTPTGWTVRAA
jgi:hypothetical protein